MKQIRGFMKLGNKRIPINMPKDCAVMMLLAQGAPLSTLNKVIDK